MRGEVHQSATLEYLAVYPDGCQDGAGYPLLVWLHGFGADMVDLAPLAASIHPAGCIHLLPNAPLGGFDGPGGTVRAWFERGGKERPAAVRLALAGLDAFVRESLARFQVGPGQAILVGFSQGGNLALRYGLARPDFFAGVSALSCSLRQPNDLLGDLPADRSQPLFLAHGVNDPVVPVGCSRAVVGLLQEQGYRPTYREYPMGHEINETLRAELAAWVARTLPPRPVGGQRG
jgi:phospholipase/carboxylesterase